MIYTIKRHILFVALLSLFGCGSFFGDKKDIPLKYLIQKVDCNLKPDESFDTSFVIKNEKFSLKCVTECSKDFPLSDTMHDRIIRKFHDRIIKFTLIGPKIDTEFVLTKQIIKDVKECNLGYVNSTLALIGINSIDTVKRNIIIRVAHLYPSGLEGTDFFDELYLDVNLKGRITISKIVPYTEPGLD